MNNVILYFQYYQNALTLFIGKIIQNETQNRSKLNIEDTKFNFKGKFVCFFNRITGFTDFFKNLYMSRIT